MTPGPGCIPCFRHADDKFDKSVSTPTLCQPPFLKVNLRQVAIMQNYRKRKATIMCAKMNFLRQAVVSLSYAASPSGFDLYVEEFWHGDCQMQTGNDVVFIQRNVKTSGIG